MAGATRLSPTCIKKYKKNVFKFTVQNGVMVIGNLKMCFSEEEIGVQHSSLRTPPRAKKKISLIYICFSGEVPTIIIFLSNSQIDISLNFFFHFLAKNRL